jgi:hypothetical protein
MESSRFRRQALPSARTVPAGEGSSWRSRFRNRSRNHKKPFRSDGTNSTAMARELGIRLIETVCVASYNHVTQGELKVLKDVASSIVEISGGRGQGVLIVDDLVDTGKTARVVREILPDAHFATVYAKPMGRPMVDTFITEVSQDTWIYFPWDTGLAFVPPIRDGEL